MRLLYRPNINRPCLRYDTIQTVLGFSRNMENNRETPVGCWAYHGNGITESLKDLAWDIPEIHEGTAMSHFRIYQIIAIHLIPL